MTRWSELFTPWRLGRYDLRNRVVMAAMTRNRAKGGIVTKSVVEYYRQRAGAGLIVTEATHPSVIGGGHMGSPGMYTEAQQEAWAEVANAVHSEGGTVFCQLMHSGRMAHPLLLPNGDSAVAPSAVRAEGTANTPYGRKRLEAPRALRADELPGVVEEFVAAAARAIESGMDGVELHAANGYLLHQFLADNTNRRRDDYGGSAENRARFVVEVTRAVAARVGPERVGLRISPGGHFNDIDETETVATYTALVEALKDCRLVYLHTMRRRSHSLHKTFRLLWPTTLMINTGYSVPSDLDVVGPIIQSGEADLVSVGRLFISNPDLVERWRCGARLAKWDEDSFYTHDDGGYVDYPFASCLQH